MSASMEVYPTSSMIETGYSHYIIFGLSILSIAWGSYNSMQVSRDPAPPALKASVGTSPPCGCGLTRLFA